MAIPVAAALAGKYLPAIASAVGIAKDVQGMKHQGEQHQAAMAQMQAPQQMSAAPMAGSSNTAAAVLSTQGKSPMQSLLDPLSNLGNNMLGMAGLRQ